MVAIAKARLSFPHALPESRLGQAHDSLMEFRRHVPEFTSAQKEYTLIVVTEMSTRKILLGKKHRGFGKGMYNSFGGKVEPGEATDVSAVRELYEETGIQVTTNDVHPVGTLHFTFADSITEMMVHLFRLQIQLDSTEETGSLSASPFVLVRSSDIRGCEEITPVWFEDWNQIPLQNMFADDSIWLPYLLLSTSPPQFDGWFHFQAGGQEVNTILHHCTTSSGGLSTD